MRSLRPHAQPLAALAPEPAAAAQRPAAYVQAQPALVSCWERKIVTASEGGTVWLIGAGFSQSLGGPLLRDLFRREHKDDIEPYFPEAEYGDFAEERPTDSVGLLHRSAGRTLGGRGEVPGAFADDAFGGSKAKKDVLYGLLHRALTEDARFEPLGESSARKTRRPCRLPDARPAGPSDSQVADSRVLEVCSGGGPNVGAVVTIPGLGPEPETRGGWRRGSTTIRWSRRQTPKGDS